MMSWPPTLVGGADSRAAGTSAGPYRSRSADRVTLGELSHPAFDPLHRGARIGDRAAMRTRDQPDGVVLEDELAQPLDMGLHVLQTRPVQRVLQEDAGQLGNRQLGKLFGELAAVLIAVVVAEAQAV